MVDDRKKGRIIYNAFIAVLSALGIASLVLFRSQIAVEIGVIGVALMIIHEVRGVSKGWWEYNGGLPRVFGKVPLEAVIIYFFSCVIITTYVMWRIGAL